MAAFLGGAENLLHPGKRDEPDYVEHIAGKNLSDDELIQVLARFPDLLMKPVLFDGTKVSLGFDPNRLAELTAS